MSYSTIVYDLADGVATLSLDRPARQNRLTALMHTELRDAFKHLQIETGARALLLGGTGDAFCAGHDLSDIASAHSEIPDLGLVVESGVNPMIRALQNLEIPVICAVNGRAAGAGVNLALACDIVFAARSASFVQDFSNVGLIPDAGGTWFLPRLLGYARATALAMLGAEIDAAQAEQWGMIWKCVDDDKLMDEAGAAARQLAAQPTKALALLKRALQQSATKNLDDQLDVERDLQRQAGRSEDFREGLEAVLKQRKPSFKGR